MDMRVPMALMIAATDSTDGPRSLQPLPLFVVNRSHAGLNHVFFRHLISLKHGRAELSAIIGHIDEQDRARLSTIDRGYLRTQPGLNRPGLQS